MYFYPNYYQPYYVPYYSQPYYGRCPSCGRCPHCSGGGQLQQPNYQGTSGGLQQGTTGGLGLGNWGQQYSGAANAKNCTSNK